MNLSGRIKLSLTTCSKHLSKSETQSMIQFVILELLWLIFTFMPRLKRIPKCNFQEVQWRTIMWVSGYSCIVGMLITCHTYLAIRSLSPANIIWRIILACSSVGGDILGSTQILASGKTEFTGKGKPTWKLVININNHHVLREEMGHFIAHTARATCILWHTFIYSLLSLCSDLVLANKTTIISA